MSVLAATSGTTYTIWLIVLWFILIPGFAGAAIFYALAQVAGERAENQAYARGQRQDDADVVVTDA
ncbi:hypothetical protein [Patulibacter medicamentivorans]|nr:hypothetical protein [Patulibacter medicamentivorans]